MKELSNQTKAAVAAAHNGTLLHDMFLTEANLRGTILMGMQDYFECTPVESSQFDRAIVLGELEALPDDKEGYCQLLDLLGEIGYRAVPAPEGLGHDWQLEPLLWHRFLDQTPKDW